MFTVWWCFRILVLLTSPSFAFGLLNNLGVAFTFQAAVQDRLNEQEGVPSVFNPPPSRPLQVNTADHRVYSYIVSRPQPRVSLVFLRRCWCQRYWTDVPLKAFVYAWHITTLILLCCECFHRNTLVLVFCNLVIFKLIDSIGSHFQGLLGWSYYLIMLPFRFTYYTLLDIFRWFQYFKICGKLNVLFFSFFSV